MARISLWATASVLVCRWVMAALTPPLWQRALNTNARCLVAWWAFPKMQQALRRYAWPSANWGSMHIEGGTSAAYRREISEAEDAEAAREELEAKLKAIASPFRTAEATGQDIIDPRDTRPLLCEFVEDAQAILRTQLGQTAVPYRP